MGFLPSLLIASFVGTIIWIVQTSVKPITQKLFSQTWHYYTGFIPVFFLLGGSAIIGRLGPLIRSIVPDTGTSPPAGRMTEPYLYDMHVPAIEQSASHRSFLNQLFAGLWRMENLQEIVSTAILIWALGAIVFLAVHVNNYRAFKRSILQNSRVCETVDCRVKVIVSSHATTPMAMGLWKPIVVLPDIPLGDKELPMIISHELVHVKRGDLLMKLIVLVANAVHWFNPAAYWLNKQLHTLCELSCDEKVVQDMDTESRRVYGETLLTMLEYGVMQRIVVCTSSFCNSKKYMKRRLGNLMSAKKLNKSIMMLSIAATISMVGIGGLVAAAAESAVPDRAVSNEVVSPQIPTGKEPQGRNVYVQSEDGTILHYDKGGNKTEMPEMRKSVTPRDYTREELIEFIKQSIKYHAPVSQVYIDQLPQKYLDEINEAYGLQLKKTESLTIEELAALTKKGIEEGTGVPQVYVDALPQKELDAINKTYGWDLQKSN